MDHSQRQVYSYCFKAIINDGTATVSITCFSDQANSLTRDCNDLLADRLPPALSTTASNQPEIIKGNIDESQEPQSTPPQTQQPTGIQKEGEPPKLPHSSVRKALFHIDPQAESTHEDVGGSQRQCIREPDNATHDWERVQ
nr:hypothetical protein [Tanacetum cinerariifolium]